MSKPVVNRPVADASKIARAQSGFKPAKEKSLKTRTREVVGGGGIQLVFEDPVKSISPQAKRSGRQCGVDPLVLEENERTRRRLAKARAARICKILSRHLARFSEKDYVKDPKIPNLHIVTGWLKGKSETELLELLVLEISGRCRAETMVKIHAQYCRERALRERLDLLKAFFHEDVINSSQLRDYLRLHDKFSPKTRHG